MPGYLGDVLPGTIVRDLWGSNGANGASITRATNGTISVYKDASTTQTTTGVTDTEDFDSLTGVHYCAIDTSADATFYSIGSTFHVVLSGATIDGQTVNTPLFSFSILRDMAKWGISDAGIAQSATSTTLVMRAGASFGDDTCIGKTCAVYGSSQGYWQERRVSDNVGSTDTLTLESAWSVTPTGTITYILFGTPPVALDAAAIRAALGFAAANADTQFANAYALLQNVQGRLPDELSNGYIKADMRRVAGTLELTEDGVGDKDVGATA